MNLLAKLLLVMLLLAALLAAAGWLSPAGAQSARALPSASPAASERAAVDLRQGMTTQQVQQLLGKPWRTALTGNAGAAAPSQGTLRWTYVWLGKPSASSAERSLHVEFNAKAAEDWRVSGWSWSTY